jgi:NAD(P)-dependent dehydrogenase (short-subunit alcohol dehydrogenase family)
MNKYLVITGGSRGIGKKTAEYFQQQHWKIINISRSPCTTLEIINVNIDLSSSKNIQMHEKELQSAIQHSSQICLVHNAAFYKKDCVDSILLDDIHTTLETNLISSIALNKIFIPLMLPQSSIIYIGSTLATKAVSGSASYIISKHALIGLMKATCQDLLHKNIYTCCICPGLVNTDLLQIAVEEVVIQNILKTQVMGKRLIEPQEIAQLIYFCANNTMINGATIHANLGQSPM